MASLFSRLPRDFVALLPIRAFKLIKFLRRNLISSSVNAVYHRLGRDRSRRGFWFESKKFETRLRRMTSAWQAKFETKESADENR